MAILRSAESLDNTVNYVATLAFFCCISCVTLMLKFGGFKASLNIFSGKKNNRDHEEYEPGLCLSGAYRTNRDEFFGNGRLSEPPKRLTPSMVKLPESHGNPSTLRPSKSTNDLLKQNNLPAHLRNSTPTVSLDPRGEEDRGPKNNKNGKQTTAVTAKQEKELAKQKKKELADQKTREKAAAQERAKQEKLAKAREKKEAKERADKAKRDKKDKKVKPPVQPAQQPGNSVAQTSTRPKPPQENPVAIAPNYPTNTLDSSISRSSGPPPYIEVPRSTAELVQTQNDPSGNISFSKPIDTSSWDMVSQHRQQVSRATNATDVQSKQRVMDLNYNFKQQNDDNSEA